MPTDFSEQYEWAETVAGNPPHYHRYYDVARALHETRAREKRLEALVRELGKCQLCDGSGETCPICAGTGLVEAARKEIQDG